MDFHTTTLASHQRDVDARDARESWEEAAMERHTKAVRHEIAQAIDDLHDGKISSCPTVVLRRNGTGLDDAESEQDALGVVLDLLTDNPPYGGPDLQDLFAGLLRRPEARGLLDAITTAHQRRVLPTLAKVRMDAEVAEWSAV